ncbi:hypothetical protein ULMS_08040 [Patiriisocius marinistellae]|uniref:Uncharacterized protein n=1 Tax=Patiriisocius marinistellae TaxID=2494560 RepID=A0A5J4FYT2_9FLAO|nr:hypothetical protein [Patiriisocius marinistellae]GEQ85296.1 hypothetical protein ULMS_08040 [Patiriisocius marinistellae]
MKKSIIIVLLLCFVCGVSNAQYKWDKQFTSDLFLIDEFIKRNAKGIEFKDTASYIGTPYNNPSYLNGNVYKDGDLLATNVALRYNCIADEMEIKESLTTDDDKAKVLTKSPNIYVKIVNDIYVFVPYQGGVENGGYFRVVHEGQQMDLYEKMEKKFTPEKKAANTLVRDTPAKFKDDNAFYIVTKPGKFYQLPKSKSKKFNVFGDNKSMIKKYAKKNNLDIDIEKDLIKVMRYYEETNGSISSR